jgi:hypothetical protein
MIITVALLTYKMLESNVTEVTMEKEKVSKAKWLALVDGDKEAFIKVFFNTVDKHHLSWLEDFYAENATLEDPLGLHIGRDSIVSYYKMMYDPVIEIAFEFEEIYHQDHIYFAPWLMKMRSSKLKGGAWIQVKGTSRIEFDKSGKKVISHRDDFDMGAMVYEHLPILGWTIRWIKSQFK